MGKNLGVKTWSIVAVLVLFVYGIFYGTGLPHGSPIKSLKDGNIHLGLDLQGGTHLVLQVHVIEAVNSETDREAQRINEALVADGARATKLDLNRPEVITITGGAPDKQSDISATLNGTDYQGYDLASAPNGGFTLTMKPETKRQIEEHTLETSIETIRERIDSLGTLDPTIEKYGLGEDQILLELPGIDDPVRVQKIIETTPKLEVHEVVGQGYASADAALQELGGAVPPDQEIVTGANVGGGSGAWVVKRAAVVAGTDFKSAAASTDENGRPDITFNLTTEAGELFFKYTDANKGTGQMAIVLDNKVLEVAGIQEGIRDQGRITGGFTQQQATDLAHKLSSGSIPATITTTETRTVGASLGASSIHHGILAAVAGMAAVMIFMLVYYRGAGLNADLALFLNLVFLLGFMGFTGATLTLPGIAGVILTIGMGVDSNVLIFERIREELRLGKTAAASIQDGFAHAWTTIFDTHVTTIVSAGILFIFGTGPVKGFAVTLVFGLLANLFTAVFVSRVIFDFLLEKRGRAAELSI